jgi:hypothetical protein
MLLELFDDNKNLPLLSQAQVNNQVNNRLMTDKSMTTPVNKHLRHQLPLSSDVTTTNLAPTDYVPETSSGTRDGLAVYNSPQTNLGAALAAKNHLEDSPAVRRLQANVRVAADHIEERGPGYSKSTASSYFRSRSEHPRQRHRNQGPLEPVAEEGRGENKVVQPVNPAANAAANAPTNPATNAPANAPANTADNVVNNAANATNVQGNAAPNPRHNAGVQLPPIQANRAEGSQRQCIRDEVEIARRANYDREHGVPDALDANNPIQVADLRHMHDRTPATRPLRPRQQPS